MIAGLMVGQVVGEDLGVVEGGWGMWDLERNDWDEEILARVAGASAAGAEELKRKLGVERSGTMGKVSMFWRERYGFGDGCVVGSCESSQLSVTIPSTGSSI